MNILYEEYCIAKCNVNRETEKKIQTIEMLWSQFEEAVAPVHIEYSFKRNTRQLEYVKVYAYVYDEDFVYSVAMDSVGACMIDTCKAMIECWEKWR